MRVNATVQLVGTLFHCPAWRQKETSTFQIHAGSPDSMQHVGSGEAACFERGRWARTKKGNAVSLVVCESPIHSLQVYPHPTNYCFAQLESPTLPRSSHSGARAYHCRMYEALLHKSTVMMIIFGSTNFCVASSILVASWASAILQLATVIEPTRVRATFVVHSE